MIAPGSQFNLADWRLETFLPLASKEHDVQVIGHKDLKRYAQPFFRLDETGAMVLRLRAVVRGADDERLRTSPAFSLRSRQSTHRQGLAVVARAVAATEGAAIRPTRFANLESESFRLLRRRTETDCTEKQNIS